MASFLNRIEQGVKSFDLYGEQVQLTYKGNATFDTCCGGIVSLIFMIAMTVTFGLQFIDLVRNPEYQNFAPTYEYDQSFRVENADSMVAIQISGRDYYKNLLTNDEIMQDLRVWFKLTNETYVDAVYCKDLYADLIDRASQSDSPRAQFFADQFKDSFYVCPNVTSFVFLDKDSTMSLKVGKCGKNAQRISSYAGDAECSKGMNYPANYYSYQLLTISSSFDADYFHQFKVPRMTAEQTTVGFEDRGQIIQKVTGSSKQIEFLDSVLNPKSTETIQTGHLLQSYPTNVGLKA